MAYPAVSGPYGMVPINLIGGQVFAGATRSFPLASGSATAIFFGDVVKLLNTGLLDKEVGTVAFVAAVGVFLGCSYTDPTFGKTFRQYYPGGVVAADITAYVSDDPDTLYKAAVVSGTTVIGSVQRTAVGENASLVQNAGNTATGDSKNGVLAATATTLTFPLRVIDVVPETALTGGNYTEVIVKFNMPSDGATGGHIYYRATGV